MTHETQSTKGETMTSEMTIRVWFQGGRKWFATYEEASQFCKTHKGARIDGTKGQDGKWYSY